MSGFEQDENDDATHASKPGPPRNPLKEVFDPNDTTWAMVLVQWRDAHEGEPGWTYTEEYEPEEVLPLTIGWVWPNKKPGFLTIVGTVMNSADNPEVVSNINHIPIGMIVSVWSLATYLPIDWVTELLD